MHLECHATLGWVLGNLAGVDRKVRNYAVIGAILPDIDAIPYVFGPYYYGLLHHTFGHNVFLGIAFAAFGGWKFKSWRAATLGLVSFGSHLLTDAFLSNWHLYLFWPLSSKGYLPANSLELSSPVNTYLVYAIPLVLAVAGLVWKRTPLEWISPRLDELAVSFFRRKHAACATCTRPANLSCDQCHRPICPKHLQVGKHWRVLCPECHPRSPSTKTSEALIHPARPERSMTCSHSSRRARTGNSAPSLAV